ncbi:SIS domain-containing protein [Latilactobacillus fuchuensis]|uniref:Tagatose-6-phosphate ketose/aldose isomerase n=2 Tax=Latilactobacillus fuchuensis TaxID=164393 RepID=A0A2N9DTK3_9LACO|nr:SIS domain-containing protein [Latilactobacillus fuchuensis]KRL58692.1 phosphosugar isomerase [Latilactobacillus fuchuensis DSM 14340 = JCM 11249]MCP8858282.1 SIS domain-containing protein [Latilactobacillus fuchuensis]SPC36940.1 tagatose-6-phosphate ketose/aldose isomerase [Latilactobacillus fuchuensis]
MFDKNETALTEMGASITTREIKQQPELWQEALANFKNQEAEIKTFLDQIKPKTADKIRVIFTGAGTSAYVGDTIVPYLNQSGDASRYQFESIPTTDIVSAPYDFLKPEVTTILVSFARSGNSPESVATVEIAKQVVQDLYEMTITCAPDGKLAIAAKEDDRNLLLMMPALANDQGFAMTGSYSCMSLTAMLVFDTTDTAKKAGFVDKIVAMGHEVIAREAEIQAVIDLDFDRIVYLGSGSLSGLTREAQLKVLELTAGKLTTMFDSSMGFRHGPKSFVNDKTLVFVFVNNQPYTRQYDVDILEEIHGDQIAAKTLAVGVPGELNFSGDRFDFENGCRHLPEGYLALADVMFAQTVSLLSSIKVGNTPDTPSPSGTVNRVVKGVTLHEYK